jgi:hypothetical protein
MTRLMSFATLLAPLMIAATSRAQAAAPAAYCTFTNPSQQGLPRRCDTARACRDA